MLLFDDDDSSNDQLDDVNLLNIRHEFEGSAGKKLLALQNRIGHDSRFRLDARFQEEQESDSDVSATEASQIDEQQRALNVLKSIVPGASLSRKNAKISQDVNIQRYDPASADHQQFEVSKKKKLKDKKSKDKSAKSKGDNSTSTDVLDADKNKYFECSSNLKDTFVPTEEPFSLFGETPVIPTDEKPLVKECEPAKKAAKSVKVVTSTGSISSTEVPQPSSLFFINTDDEKVQASLAFFCQHDKVKDTHKEWLEKKYHLIQLYRQRHRDSIRRLKTNNNSGLKNKTFKKRK